MVVDEVHVYSGIFGSNVHYIIKRLKRLCNNKMQFVAASATLDDAKGFCQQLFTEEMQLISDSGRKSLTDFVMLSPSLRTQRKLMVELTKKMTGKNHKTMVFNNSHLNSELLAIQAKNKRSTSRFTGPGLMTSYRTRVEQEFKDDMLSAISCTPTLELGIDIGSVDCVIFIHHSGEQADPKNWKGIAKGTEKLCVSGIRKRSHLRVLQKHPDDYFEDTEKTYIDPKNPFVEEFQVLAMACDRPISRHELKEHSQVIDIHIANGNLVLFKNRIVPNFENIRSTLSDYSIRGIGKSIGIYLGDKKIGERALPIALEELHKDAIYFLAGTRYRVKEFEHPKKSYAKLERIPMDYPHYTRALADEWPTIGDYL